MDQGNEFVLQRSNDLEIRDHSQLEAISIINNSGFFLPMVFTMLMAVNNPDEPLQVWPYSATADAYHSTRRAYIPGTVSPLAIIASSPYLQLSYSPNLIVLVWVWCCLLVRDLPCWLYMQALPCKLFHLFLAQETETYLVEVVHKMMARWHTYVKGQVHLW